MRIALIARMDRMEKHALPKRRIALRLRRAGFRIQPVTGVQSCDLLVNERVRVALRVAFPRIREHHVTGRRARYTYRYRSWNFNFHHHGKLGKRYADVFVCIAMDPENPSREEVFVIPWDAVSGMTFSLFAERRRAAGRYAKFLNRWSVIREAVVATAPPMRQVA